MATIRILASTALALAVALNAAPGDRLFQILGSHIDRYELPTGQKTLITTANSGGGGACSPAGLIYTGGDAELNRFDQDGGNHLKIPIVGSPIPVARGLAFDEIGDLWINTEQLLSSAGAGGWRLERGDPFKTPELVFPPFTTEGLDVAVVAGGPHKGALLFADTQGMRVMISEPLGSPLRELIPRSVLIPVHGILGLATNGCGEIFVGVIRPGGTIVERFDPDGQFLEHYLAGGDAGHSIAFDSEGNMYTGSDAKKTIWKVTPDKTKTLFASPSGGYSSFFICRDEPLVCAAGGPYRVECSAQPTCVTLSAHAPGGTCREFVWTSDCPGADFGGTETSATPTLCVPATSCPTTCTATVKVKDGPREAECSADLLIEDTLAPIWSGVPASTAVGCERVPPPAAAVAEDDCDPAPALAFAENRVDGRCPGDYLLDRTWAATDSCANAASVSQTLTVTDRGAPWLDGVPAGGTVECSNVPPAALPVARDACDPAPGLSSGEKTVAGACPQSYVLERSWTAIDWCGLAVTQSQTLNVVDSTPPRIKGVPADATVECDAVPPPALPTVGDDCDPDPALAYSQTRSDGDCPGNYLLTRNWIATDHCGNSAGAAQAITVEDTTPPILEPGTADLRCLWPPNHRYACFAIADFDPGVRDACSEPVALRLAGCESDQPDDADERDPDSRWGGDGNTRDDCVVRTDGLEICVRAERAGTGLAAANGRRYRVAMVAVDACGNASAPVVIGRIHVPHDRRESSSDCR